MATAQLPVSLTNTSEVGEAVSQRDSASTIRSFDAESEVLSPSSSRATTIADEAVNDQAIYAHMSGIQLAAAPQASVVVNGVQYATGEIRTMMDTVVRARSTHELPPTKAMTLDASVIVQDYGFLNQLRAARGDPAVPPSQEYINLRVEVARQVKERDDSLNDANNLRAARERVDNYLHVANIERRYFQAAQGLAQRRGVQLSSQADMDAITDEIIGVVENAVETSVVDATGPIRINANRLATTANNLDSTAGSLDSTAGSLDSTAGSLDSTAGSLNSAAGSLDSTARSVESIAKLLITAIGLLAAQTNTTSAQIQGLSNLTVAHQMGGPASNNQARGAVDPALAQALYNALNALHRENNRKRGIRGFFRSIFKF
ncbi:unnamed protein product [Parascedosporium putredinis]|uniref:Uncharacterized protein n=1 Tax=Parascedosporium putredinis TaxID=1442378 RepID=A0A9P1GY73_9PEZI|nr:unnamed protein product [Parascedosporium putredinis]CAI7990486.1 unnamed protein product [Parascedosporium putredinis]